MLDKLKVPYERIDIKLSLLNRLSSKYRIDASKLASNDEEIKNLIDSHR